MAYARQLYGQDGLPAGSFDAQFSFAQALTDAAREVPNAMLVVSIPASDIEVGGEGGRQALTRILNVVGRMETSWTPATADEGFEIVRRRLFESIAPEGERERDSVIHRFGELYRSQKGDFPSECGEAEYERRLKASYPIHPELFDRLYGEWSTLERFQRTRGVLRLMATVIYELWRRDDRSLLIMPGTLPLGEGPVVSELKNYLDEAWVPVIAKDVDGENATPLHLDNENPTFGRYSAARRVARTVFMGSAPVTEAANRGIDDRRIKLGCVQPGEAPATFGDALRHLANRALYLSTDGGRYWYSLQQTVTRLAADRAALVPAGGRRRGDPPAAARRARARRFRSRPPGADLAGRRRGHGGGAARRARAGALALVEDRGEPGEELRAAHPRRARGRAAPEPEHARLPGAGHGAARGAARRGAAATWLGSRSSVTRKR